MLFSGNWSYLFIHHDAVTIYSQTQVKPKTRERKDVQYIEQTSGDLTPWAEKSEIGYFRGRDSNPGRLTLCEMSMNHPEDVDARYVTKNFVTKRFATKMSY